MELLLKDFISGLYKGIQLINCTVATSVSGMLSIERNISFLLWLSQTMLYFKNPKIHLPKLINLFQNVYRDY